MPLTHPQGRKPVKHCSDQTQVQQPLRLLHLVSLAEK
jgi:hypothetical protein